jgi:hypothetical protein
MENIRVKYTYTLITPYKDLEDGTPDFHHTPVVTVTNTNGKLKDLLECLSHNSKLGQIIDIDYEILEPEKIIVVTQHEELKYKLSEYGLILSDKVEYDKETYCPYRGVTHPLHVGKVWKYTPEFAQDINGPYGVVDAYPVMKEELIKVFGKDIFENKTDGDNQDSSL